MNKVLIQQDQEKNNFINENHQNQDIIQKGFSETYLFDMIKSTNFNQVDDNSNQIAKQNEVNKVLLMTPSQNCQKKYSESSQSNTEQHGENRQYMMNYQQPQSVSSQSESTINNSPQQIEQICSLQVAFSRQISEKQCQQLKMNSDFDEFSLATPISLAISSSNNKRGKTLTDDEDQQVVKNIFQDLNKIQTNNIFDVYINNQQIDREDNNYFDESEDDDQEQNTNNKNYSKQQFIGNNLKNQTLNNNKDCQDNNKQIIDKDESEEYYESNDESIEEDEEIEQTYDNKQKFLKNKNYPCNKKQVDLFLEQGNQIKNQNKDLFNQKDTNQIQQLINHQNRQHSKENNSKQIINFSSSNISSSQGLFNQVSQQAINSIAEDTRSSITNINNDIQIKHDLNCSTNQNQIVNSQQTVKSDQINKKLDLVQRMQQFKGELKNDIEQAHNELLKLKTSKSIKLQDSCESSSQHEFLQKQSIHDSINNTKLSLLNIEQNSITEILTESQQNNNNNNNNSNVQNTQTKIALSQQKQSEIKINTHTHHIIGQNASIHLKQQLTLSPSNTNSDFGNCFKSFKDNYSSLYYEQNSNQSNLNENLSSQQNKQIMNVETRIKKYVIPDHSDQLQFMEQEKIQLQQIILEKEKQLLFQQKINSSQHSIQTILPPSKDISFFSNDSEQIQSNTIPIQFQEKINQYILDQEQQNNIQQFKQIQQAKDKNIPNQHQEDASQSKKKVQNFQKNSLKKQQKQKQAKTTFNQKEENSQNKQKSQNIKNLISRNLSNPKIQEQNHYKADGLATEGIQMIKQLDQKYSMQLQEIHYKHHLKLQKLSDKIKQLEDENNQMRHEVQQRQIAAKELKESEARIVDLASSIQDIQMGKLIQQELQVNSLEEVYEKIKSTQLNHEKEKKFISCILDMVKRCNPEFIQNSQQIQNSSNLSSNHQQIQNNSKQQSGNSQQQHKDINQTSLLQQQEQANLKKAWKWLKFIIEDYVNLKSKNIHQISNTNGKLDKNNLMYRSCVVENQTLQKQNQIDINQPPSLSLISDTVVLQEINTLLNTENKYESLKSIKEILTQNEQYRQQINYLQKKVEHKQTSQIPQQTPASSKRVNTQGISNFSYNTQKDPVNQSITQQSLYFQNPQQQQRLLSPKSSSQYKNSQSFKQSSKNSGNNNFNQCGFPSNYNINSNINCLNETNVGMQKQLMRGISPQKNNIDDYQSENDQNQMNCVQNSNYNNISQTKQNLQMQNYPNNQKIQGNQNKCTSPSRRYPINNVNYEKMITLNTSPRENNCVYNNQCVQYINSPSQSYTKTKINQYFNGNLYQQVPDKQSAKQL